MAWEEGWGAVAGGAAAQGSKKVAEWIFQMKGKNVIFCAKPILNWSEVQGNSLIPTIKSS